MDDRGIITLYLARNQRAVAETKEKYVGRLRLLGRRPIEDEETVEITADYLNYGSVRTAQLTLAKTEEGLRIASMAG